MGRWVVANPSTCIVLGSTSLIDGRLGFFFPDLSLDTVYGLFTTDPSSGIVLGFTIVDPSPDTFSVIFSSDPTYIMIFITSLSINFIFKPLKFLGRT